MLYQNFRIFFQSRICPSIRGQTYRCLYVHQILCGAEKRGTTPVKFVETTSKNDQVGVPLGAKGIFITSRDQENMVVLNLSTFFQLEMLVKLSGILELLYSASLQLVPFFLLCLKNFSGVKALNQYIQML